MWGNMQFGGGSWGGLGIGMVLVWGVILAIIVLLVRGVAGRSPTSVDKTPLQLLKERYARGDIGREEFEQKKRDLEAG